MQNEGANTEKDVGPVAPRFYGHVTSLPTHSTDCGSTRTRRATRSKLVSLSLLFKKLPWEVIWPPSPSRGGKTENMLFQEEEGKTENTLTHLAVPLKVRLRKMLDQVSISLSLSVCLSACLSVCLSVFLSLSLSLSLFSLSLSLSLPLSLYLSIYLSLNNFIETTEDQETKRQRAEREARVPPESRRKQKENSFSLSRALFQ